MLIDLGSCDMVLGVQWLSTLGTINWDFKKLVLEFKLQGKLMKIEGIGPKKIKVMQGESSLKMLKGATQLCMLQIHKVDVLQDSGQISNQSVNNDDKL